MALRVVDPACAQTRACQGKNRYDAHSLYKARPLSKATKTFCKLLPALLLVASTLSAQPALSNERLVTGLSDPIWAGSPPGDRERIFIAEQNTGRVRFVRAGTLTTFHTEPVLAGAESGLMGFAFHPDFAANGHFFLSFTRPGDGAAMLVRYTASASDPDRSDPATRTVMFGPVAQPFSNHNCCHVEFGPDGFLYWGMGDGGSGGDPGCRAQNGNSLLGKMLRLDVDTAGPAAIPASNPFVGVSAVRDEVWATGFRNPWRFSIDPANGDLWIGDVGQSTAG